MTKPPRPTEPIEPQWTEVLRTYGEGFAGRKAELAALHRAWNEGVRVFVLYAQVADRAARRRVARSRAGGGREGWPEAPKSELP
ncbi:MAG TPA: hypothetical protein VJ725_18950 [Thermoanaerobaculia bacterium]|nr:hypothetical protein [Thermoanaerobaculia bacterium]